jgi:hypothetical protein
MRGLWNFFFVKSSNCNFVGTQLQHISYK